MQFLKYFALVAIHVTYATAVAVSDDALNLFFVLTFFS